MRPHPSHFCGLYNKCKYMYLMHFSFMSYKGLGPCPSRLELITMCMYDGFSGTTLDFCNAVHFQLIHGLRRSDKEFEVQSNVLENLPTCLPRQTQAMLNQ